MQLDAAYWVQAVHAKGQKRTRSHVYSSSSMATLIAPPFSCPICSSEKFVAVHVQRPSGAWYWTPFYRCFGCSVMFTDPSEFAGKMNRGDGIDRAPRNFKGGGSFD